MAESIEIQNLIASVNALTVEVVSAKDVLVDVDGNRMPAAPDTGGPYGAIGREWFPIAADVETGTITVTLNNITSTQASPALSGVTTGNPEAVTILVEGQGYAATLGTDSWSLPSGRIPALANGDYTVTALASKAGTAGASTAATLTIDVPAQAPPQITVNDVSSRNTSPEISGTISSPDAVIEVVIGTSRYNATNSGDGTWVLAAGEIIPLAEGTYTINAQATLDAFDTRTLVTGELVVLPATDVDPPVVTFDSIAETNSVSPELTGTIDDPDADLVVTSGGTDYSADANGDGTWTLAANIIADLGQGDNTLTITATNAGGSDTATATVTVVVSDTPAQAVAVDGTNTSYYETASDVAAITSDTPTTIGAWVLCSNNANSDPYNFVFGSNYAGSGSDEDFVVNIRGATNPNPDNQDFWEVLPRAIGAGQVFGGYGGDNTWRLLLINIDNNTLTIEDALEGQAPVQRATTAAPINLIAANRWRLGSSTFNQLSGQFEGNLGQVFIYPGSLSFAQKQALANGDTIGSIGTPLHWWKLNGADDTADYGSASAPLILTGPTPTTVAGPANVTDSGESGSTVPDPDPTEPPPDPVDTAPAAFTAADLNWANDTATETVDIEYVVTPLGGGSTETLTLDNAGVGVSPLKRSDGSDHPHLAVARYSDCVCIENVWITNDTEYSGRLKVRVDGATVVDENFTCYLFCRNAPIRAGITQITPTRNWAANMLPNYEAPAVMDDFGSLMTSSRLSLNGIGLNPSSGMGGTGGRHDIGVHPGSNLLWALKGEHWDQAQAGSDHMAPWPVHLRDPATGMVADPSVRWEVSLHPNLRGVTFRGRKNPVSTRSSSPNNPDRSHFPNFCAIPFMSTGSDFHLEELTFCAAYQSLWENPGYRGYENPRISGSQTRGLAWQLNLFAHAATLLPAGHPQKSTYENMVAESNRVYWDGLYAPGQSRNNQFNIIFEVVYEDRQDRSRGIAPWQMHHFASALAQAHRMGLTSIEPLRDYVVGFAVKCMTEMCYQLGSFYALMFIDPAKSGSTDTFKTSDTSLLFDSWADVERNNLLDGHYGTSLADQESVPCGQKDVGFGVGVMRTTSAWRSFGANMQPAVAAGVDAGLPNAQTAWNLFRDNSNNIDYGPAATYSIVPS